MSTLDLRPREVNITARPGTDITIACTVEDWALTSPTVTAEIKNRDGTPAAVTTWGVGVLGQVITLTLDEADTELLGQGAFTYALVVTVAGNTLSPFAGILSLSDKATRAPVVSSSSVSTEAGATITISPILIGDATLIDGGTATGGDELIDGGSA